MKVLITGAAGQVGSALVSSAPAWAMVTALDSAQLDISDHDAVKSKLLSLQPELIINAAAYTAVDRAESDEQRATEVNCNGPANLGLAAACIDAPVFHISTDYVFSGNATRPYGDKAEPDPKTAYGRGKLAGERALANVCRKHLTLRTSWVFSEQGSNFVKTMLRLGQELPQLRVVGDQVGGPTSAQSVAEALWCLAGFWRNGEIGQTDWGVYHFSGGPAVSWYEFAGDIFSQAQVCGVLDQCPAVAEITTADFPTPAKRPAYTVLDCSRLDSVFGIKQPDWREGLRRVLESIHVAKT